MSGNAFCSCSLDVFRKLEDTRAYAQDVHDRPISVTRRSVGFLLTLALADPEQEITRLDLADPPTPGQGVHVVLEAPKVTIDITHAVGLLRSCALSR